MMRVPSTVGAPDTVCPACPACPQPNGSSVMSFALGFVSSLLASYVFYQMGKRGELR